MMLLSLIELFVEDDVSHVFASCFSIHRSCLTVAKTVVGDGFFDFDCNGMTTVLLLRCPSSSFANEMVTLIGLLMMIQLYL